MPDDLRARLIRALEPYCWIQDSPTGKGSASCLRRDAAVDAVLAVVEEIRTAETKPEPESQAEGVPCFGFW